MLLRGKYYLFDANNIKIIFIWSKYMQKFIDHTTMNINRGIIWSGTTIVIRSFYWIKISFQKINLYWIR